MEQVTIWLSIGALVLAGVSAALAFWQASISKEQLRLARETEQRTERTLESINKSTSETRQAVQDVKNSIEDRITKILDSRLEDEKNRQTTSANISAVLTEKLMEAFTPKSQPPKAPE
jgi:signal recognition particle GTPase